jgi:kynurenine formamidase
MTRLIDISLPLGAGYEMHTPEGVTDLQIRFELLKDYPGGAGQRVSGVRMRVHHGTHVDAPMHFVPGGPPISALPLDTFYGPAVLGDLTFVGEDSPIGPAELDEAFGDRALPGSRLLLRTDWNHHYGEPDYQARSPYIGPAGLDWIVARRPRLVSYDYSHSKDAPDAPTVLHAVRTYLSAGIVTMGYVTNLDQIDPALPVTLCAFPLAFRGTESCPVRAVVVQEDLAPGPGGYAG